MRSHPDGHAVEVRILKLSFAILVAFLVAIAVGLFVVDGIVRRSAEKAVAEVVASRSPAGTDVRVEIGGWLFVPDLIAGRIESVEVTASPVPANGLTFSSVSVRVEGVVFERQAMLQRRAAIKSIEGGTLTATLGSAELTRVLGLPVAVHAGGADVTVPGAGTVRVPVTLADGRLRLSLPGGRQLSVVIPSLPILPCASGLTLAEGEALLGCTFTEVPPALLRETAEAGAAASPG